MDAEKKERESVAANKARVAAQAAAITAAVAAAQPSQQKSRLFYSNKLSVFEPQVKFFSCVFIKHVLHHRFLASWHEWSKNECFSGRAIRIRTRGIWIRPRTSTRTRRPPLTAPASAPEPRAPIRTRTCHPSSALTRTRIRSRRLPLIRTWTQAILKDP